MANNWILSKYSADAKSKKEGELMKIFMCLFWIPVSKSAGCLAKQAQVSWEYGQSKMKLEDYYISLQVHFVTFLFGGALWDFYVKYLLRLEYGSSKEQVVVCNSCIEHMVDCL